MHNGRDEAGSGSEAGAGWFPGDPAPWFHQRSFANPHFAFHTAGGRYVVLCFFGSAADAHSQAALDAVRSRPHFFNDRTACFFGVSADPADESEKRVADSYPGYRFFLDFDASISRLYGAVSKEEAPDSWPFPCKCHWLVLDPTLRVLKTFPFADDCSDIDILLDYLDNLPPPDRYAGMELQAPVILLPNVFEPVLCRQLIAFYETHGGEESGFMREVDGKTVIRHDHHHKRRKDYLLQDQEFISKIQARFARRIVPEIKKVHQFEVTRMERYLVGCYAEEDEGHFNPHRDNTTKGTAHRRFAVSINLNSNFEGGSLHFPEYGPRQFKPPVGSAVVFSCSLLHAVSKVTRGRRYAFLPFLYDDAAARIREANNPHLDESVGAYQT
ncbi:MAG: 2OG-Fe(II) oxygenase [Geminicoccaceae bacterium]